MANNFSSDGSCKALYNFESGYLSVDSKGTNNLTISDVTSDTGNYKQGSGSADFEKDLTPTAYRTDGNLSAGFPLKSGDTTKTGAFAFWIRPETFATAGFICGKYDADNNKRSFGVWLNTNGRIKVYSGYNSGSSATYYESSKTLTAGRWYHITVSFDGVNKKLAIYVWDDYSQTYTVNEFVLSYEIYVADAEFTVGCKPGATPEYYDGQLDELVVFSTPKSYYEINQLRSGTYTGEAALLVTNVGLNVEYRQTPQQNVTQLIAQVLYTPPDENTYIYYGSLETAVAPTSTRNQEWSKTGDLPVAISPTTTYFYNPPGHFEFHANGIAAVITPSSTHINCPQYNGQVGITVAPAADIWVQTRAYNGDIGLSLEPTAAVKIPVPGRDSDTGYGIVDISFLSATPPYWSIQGGIPMDLDPTATSCVLYSEANRVASGGVKFGGAGTVAFVEPLTTAVIATGGVKVTGGNSPFEDPYYRFVEPVTSTPTVRAVVASGGVEIAGDGFPVVHRLDTIAVVASGGIAIEGAGTHDLPELPATRAVIGEGGITIAGPYLPPYAFIAEPEQPAIIDPQGGCLEVGGHSVIRFVQPPEIDLGFDRADVGGLRVGGSALITLITPVTIHVTAEGGVIVGGGGQTPVYETWVLAGLTFEPSLYSNFVFNSYAEQGDALYAAKDDGIYSLEGDTDNGVRIKPGVRIGPTNFGVNNQKRIRTIDLGDTPGEDVRAQITSGSKSNVIPFRRGKLAGTRDVAGSHLTIDLADFDQIGGTDIDLVVLARR